MAYHINKPDIGHTHLREKKKKNTQIAFGSPSLLRRRGRNRMTIAKLLSLHANATNISSRYPGIFDNKIAYIGGHNVLANFLLMDWKLLANVVSKRN